MLLMSWLDTQMYWRQRRCFKFAHVASADCVKPNLCGNEVSSVGHWQHGSSRMHSFSGHVALSFAPSPPQPADCRLSKVKQAPTRTWLRSGSFATLTLGVQQQGGEVYVQVYLTSYLDPCSLLPITFKHLHTDNHALQVHLKGKVLLHISRAVSYSLLSPEDTGQGWIFAASVPENIESRTQVKFSHADMDPHLCCSLDTST